MGVWVVDQGELVGGPGPKIKNDSQMLVGGALLGERFDSDQWRGVKGSWDSSVGAGAGRRGRGHHAASNWFLFLEHPLLSLSLLQSCCAQGATTESPEKPIGFKGNLYLKVALG